ncbi:helix-turn-helix domain-containing protein, partial [Nocardia carnea]|uniref:helix-turn-helix domain-containing protein n=1 Tax=Nocardia carnea TaxID=37328 RepID=UPI00245564DC
RVVFVSHSPRVLAWGGFFFARAVVLFVGGRGGGDNPLEALSSREREVLALMAEGLSNAGIGRRLWITEGTVEKHVRSILTKLDLTDTADDHRRVRAVIMFLDAAT